MKKNLYSIAIGLLIYGVSACAQMAKIGIQNDTDDKNLVITISWNGQKKEIKFNGKRKVEIEVPADQDYELCIPSEKIWDYSANTETSYCEYIAKERVKGAKEYLFIINRLMGGSGRGGARFEGPIKSICAP